MEGTERWLVSGGGGREGPACARNSQAEKRALDVDLESQKPQKHRRRSAFSIWVSATAHATRPSSFLALLFSSQTFSLNSKPLTSIGKL